MTLRWLAATLVLLAAAACTPTGPPATGANSSSPNAVEQGEKGNPGGGSNQFTPGHTTGAPASAP